MVKRRDVTERRSARERIVRIPGEEKLVRSVESEFGSGSGGRKGSEEVLQDSKLPPLRPKTHGPGRQAAAGRRGFGEVCVLRRVEPYGIRHGIRSCRVLDNRGSGYRGCVNQSSGGRRLRRIANEAGGRSGSGRERRGIARDVRRSGGKNDGSLEHGTSPLPLRRSRNGDVGSAEDDGFGIVSRPGIVSPAVEKPHPRNPEPGGIELQKRPIGIAGGVVRTRLVPGTSGKVRTVSGKFDEGSRKRDAGE